MAKRHSVTVQSLIESTTSTTVPIGALQFHTSSTIHLAPCPHPCSIPMCSRPERHRRRGANTRGSQRWPRVMLARYAAHTPQFSRISLWLGSCIPMCRPERHRGSTGAVATTRGSAVCVAARPISRAMRPHSAILAQRRRLVVSKGLARHVHWQTQRVVRGARAIRGVQQRDGSKVQFLRAIWRVARREWRCAADAPHLTWCAAARPRIGCSAPPAWPARLKCS